MDIVKVISIFKTTLLCGMIDTQKDVHIQRIQLDEFGKYYAPMRPSGLYHKPIHHHQYFPPVILFIVIIIFTCDNI